MFKFIARKLVCISFFKVLKKKLVFMCCAFVLPLCAIGCTKNYRQGQKYTMPDIHTLIAETSVTTLSTQHELPRTSPVSAAELVEINIGDTMESVMDSIGWPMSSLSYPSILLDNEELMQVRDAGNAYIGALYAWEGSSQEDCYLRLIYRWTLTDKRLIAVDVIVIQSPSNRIKEVIMGTPPKTLLKGGQPSK